MLDGGMGLYYVQLGEIEVSEVVDNSTSLLLTWTAPGDDGWLGQANAYDIRYKTTMIDSRRGRAATSVPDEPTPQAAGATEGYELKNLVPGMRYFVALKTADEVYNWSLLSNVTTIVTAARYVEGIVLLCSGG